MHENAEKETAHSYMSNRLHFKPPKIINKAMVTSTATQAKWRTVITVSLKIIE